MRVRRPSISYSCKARSMRRVAASRSTSQTISLATSGSYMGLTSEPSRTPESIRTPGPAGSRYPVIRPGAGAKFLEASSALIRHSIAWPDRRTSSWPSDSGSPAAMRSCSRTMSSPVTSSLTGCSTWSRAFSSMK